MQRRNSFRTIEYSSPVVRLAIVFCLLVALGFPGQLSQVLGSWSEKMLEYVSFGIEIFLMLFINLQSLEDITIVKLKGSYGALYLYILQTTIISMMVTSFPSEQMISCVRLFVTLLFCIWLQENFKPDEINEMFGFAQMLFIMATVFVMMAYPRLAYESGKGYKNALCGLYPSKNACATELVFGGLIFIECFRKGFKQKRPSVIWLGLFFITGILTLMCQATGAILCAAIPLVYITFFRQIRLPLGILYVAANVLFLVSMLTLMPLFQDLIIAMGKDATLTGRIPLWNRVIEIMLEGNTLTGFGYGMFWRDQAAVKLIHRGFSRYENPFMASMTTGAHNVVMEMWLNAGLIGIAFFFVAAVFSFRKIRELDDNAYRFSALLLLFILINGLTERCLVDTYSYRMMAIFLAMTTASNPAYHTRRAIEEVPQSVPMPTLKAEM